MKKSQRQMILMGVCLLGVAAFVYDKLQPDSATISQAQAQSSSPRAAVAAAMTADDSATASLVMPCQAVKERLQKAAGGAANNSAGVSGGTSLRDVFSPSESWLPRVAQAPTCRAPEHADGEAFLQSHKLQAVMLSDGSPKVIVNDKSLRIGQEIDGFKLIKVENRHAVFASIIGDGATIELFQKTGIRQE